MSEGEYVVVLQWCQGSIIQKKNKSNLIIEKNIWILWDLNIPLQEKDIYYNHYMLYVLVRIYSKFHDYINKIQKCENKMQLILIKIYLTKTSFIFRSLESYFYLWNTFTATN